MPVEKNKEYIVEIIDNGFAGEGIAKINDFTIFIPNTLKGEKVKVLIVKVLKSHAFGKIVEILEKSQDRVECDCNTYKRCGGCDLRHVKYEKTLEMKQNAVQSLVNKTHEIIPIQECLIQNKKSQELANFIIKFINDNNISVYNEKNQNGLIRHIVTKVGIKTNEIMCIIVINGKNIPKEKELVKQIIDKFPEVKTVVKNINMKNTNVIMGKENINIYGEGYINDKLGEYIFKISPHSFYQVNPIQAEKLYNIGVKAAQISKNNVVFDLYCGIGTISLFMSKYAKKVYGIEIVEQAIEDAKENAKINNVENAEFIAGDVEKVLDDLINKKNVIPDIIMIDPPRKGMDENSIKNILKISPKKLVYISCNPATLVRDLAEFEEKYDVKTIEPVDMFPYSKHVECVSVLELK